jgi:hypothetical protein
VDPPLVVPALALPAAFLFLSTFPFLSVVEEAVVETFWRESDGSRRRR